MEPERDTVKVPVPEASDAFGADAEAVTTGRAPFESSNAPKSGAAPVKAPAETVSPSHVGETVELRLSASPAYEVGRPSMAAVTISDDDSPRPELSVAATAPTASEAGSEPGIFTITRTGSTAAALVVRYTLGGEAVNGADYALLGLSVRIPAGASSVDVAIVPVDDAVADEEEVSLTLVASPAYVLGARSGATLTINDNDGGK